MKKSEIERLCNLYIYHADFKNSYLRDCLSGRPFDELHAKYSGICDGIFFCFNMLGINYHIFLDHFNSYDFIKGIEIKKYGIKKFVSSDDSNAL